MAEYVGIERDDLLAAAPPPGHPEAHWGRYGDWKDKAYRISMALSRMRDVSEKERESVPHGMRARRRDREIESRSSGKPIKPSR
jgi:hypothetical protein